jgi:predicted negative regulator of RcsB-dependent stress response
VSAARLLAALAAVTFVVGLAATFGWTYRDQSNTVSSLRAERASLRAQRASLQAENRRLAASLASAESAFGALNAGLAQTRADVTAARRDAGARWLDGYVAGWLAAVQPDPNADELPQRRSRSQAFAP